jgi:hypothetical protein
MILLQKTTEMKILFTLLLLPVLVVLSFNTTGQTTAMDFTRDECGGDSHQLFTEMDAGKVVILEFVMLNCAPCIIGTNALQGITAEYEISHPGRVRIYSFGFLNSYTCEQMLAWKNDNSYTHPVFNEGEDQVAYYGGMGMPTIVVIGTNEHNVFFKSIGYTPAVDDKIREAIDSALLYDPTGVSEISSSDFKIYPTLVSDQLYIETGDALRDASVILYDSFGRLATSAILPGIGRFGIPVSGLASGIYFARIQQGKSFSEGVKVIIL